MSAKAVAVLSRAMCRFEFLPLPVNLSSSNADKAARLFAEMNAPFRRADFVIVRGVLGFGIWWWDSEKVGEVTGSSWAYDADNVLPESVLQADGEGWRQVGVEEGYEAQCWHNSTLIASVWRRRPFNEEQWRAFTQSVSADAEAPPEAPPAPQPLALALHRVATLPRLRAPPGWKRAERAGRAVVTLAIMSALVFIGGAVRYEMIARQNLAELQALDDAAPEQDENTQHDLETLEGLEARLQQPNPVLVAARAFKALQPFAVDATGWAVEESRLRIEIANAGETPVERVASALEADDWLYNVSAQLDSVNGRTLFFADVCPSVQRQTCLAESQAP